jgi:hypothetical protein
VLCSIAVRGIGRAALVLTATIVACGDDSAGGGADGAGTDASGGSEAATLDETGDPPCVAAEDCDDTDPCTIDRCDAGTCGHDLVEPDSMNVCRPQIEVDFPPRGATILGDAGDPEVIVTGTVTSALGSIATLTLDGVAVDVGPDGEFSHAVAPTVGGNALVFEAVDEAGQARKRVQSFLWSTGFRSPTTPPTDIADDGLAFWLSQQTVDDGEHTAPHDDLGSLAELVIQGFDPGAVIDPATPIAHQAGYDIYITDIAKGPSAVALQSIDGGAALTANVDQIVGDLYFDCTTWECELAGGDGTGGFSIATVNVVADLLLGADADHKLDATVVGVDATVNPDDVEVWADNAWTDFLVAVAEVFVKDQLVADLEAELESNIEQQLGPAIAGALGSLALATSFELPNLGDMTMPIVVELVADFRATDFHDGIAPPEPSPPPGGEMLLRGGGYATDVVTRYQNLGVPDRAGCANGPQVLATARAAPLEIAIADDLLNQLLHAGWRGGLLEFPLTDATSNVAVSGMLAPTASDCGDTGMLLAHIGDVHLQATVTVLDDSIEFEAWTSFVVRVVIGQTDSGISLGIDGVERVDTELTVASDVDIAKESSLIELVESKLVDGLIGQLGDGLGTFALPAIDLSGPLGQPPGTAVVEIHVDEVVRQDGATLLSAHL